ncbi:MAG: T9SS type A sorting domain-containing protein [Saprospiraceae bacterium]|nr:T9SS type A sorting domain-containing protein [Saprospiraceae bacterium]
MKKRNLLVFIIALCILNLNAQLKPAQYLIHSNEVAAMMRNDGAMFTIEESSNPIGSFKVPFAGLATPSSIFNCSLLISGVDSDESKFVVGDLYTPKYNPGPLGDLQELTYEEMLNYNKIWSVYGQEIIMHIDDYKKDGVINVKLNNIFAWPGRGNQFFKNYNGFEIPDIDLAPFYDIDKNGIYNPDKGDYPKVESVSEELIPASIHWTVFHKSSKDVDNIKFEVGLTSWTFNCDNSILNRTIFNNYKIVNRSDKDLEDLSICMFIDPDLGCYTDDYFGSFESLNASYWYNSDNVDGEGTSDSCSNRILTYKGNTPVQSFIFLNKKLESFVAEIYDFNGPWLPDLYNNTIGKPGGNNIINPKTNKVTKIMYPGLPTDTSTWSILSEKGLIYVDVRGYNSTFIEELKSQKSVSVDLAYVFHHHPDSSNLQNVLLARDQLIELQNIYNSNFKLTCSSDNCKEECVWPGDTDNNGLVDYFDAVNIYKTVGEQGSKRNDFWEWQAQKSLPWNKKFSSGLNLKYADADGDGEVSSVEDIEVIVHNESKTHGIYNIPIQECKSGPELKVISTRDTVFKSSFLPIEIKLINRNKNFQGISFEFKVDSSFAYFVKFPDTRIWKDNNISQYNYSRIFQNLENREYFLGQYVYFNDKLSNQLPLDTVIWRSVVFKRPSSTNFSKNYFDVEICNARMYFEDGSVDTLGSNKVRLYLTPNGLVDIKNKYEIEIFPNPATNIIILVSEVPMRKLEILSLQGQVIKIAKCNSESYEFNIADLQSGCYILNIHTEIGIVKKKFVKSF